MNLKFISLIVHALLGYGVLAQRGPYVGDNTFVFKLQVSQDVTLWRGDTNYDHLEFLIVGLHPGYPLKRSLVQFETLPSNSRCEVSDCSISIVALLLVLRFMQ